MKNMSVNRGVRRWTKSPAALLLGLGAIWLLVLARLSYTWHTQYRQTLLALSTLQETQYISSPVLRNHLLHMAASLLGSPLAQRIYLSRLAIHNMHHLAASQWFVSPPIWAMGFVVMTVAVFWLKQNRITVLESEHAALKEQFLAIARGWALLATDPDGRQVMQNILQELAQHTAVTEAAIYRLTGARLDALELYVSLGPLSLTPGPIPSLFLEPERGLIGDALAHNQPRYSGDYGEMGYLIPGTRLPRVAVFPARYRDHNWGVLLLSSDEIGWFHAYRDVLEVLAQEVAIAAASVDVAEQVRHHRLMEDRSRMQSDILANVSHELRTPLGLVKGYLETLQESGSRLSPEDRQEFLEVAVAETQELESLIAQLLTMSRMESADLPHQPEWFAMGSWLPQTLERYPVWERQRVRVIQSSRLSMAFGDPRTLTTLLSDLLGNALKYSSGAIDLHLDQEQDWWTITVRDYGPGVNPEVLGRVFERFYRAPGHAQSTIRGSGLGLSIAKHLVEIHGGKIQAANALGGGFVVSVHLPLRPEESKQGGAAGGRRRISAGY